MKRTFLFLLACMLALTGFMTSASSQAATQAPCSCSLPADVSPVAVDQLAQALGYELIRVLTDSEARELSNQFDENSRFRAFADAQHIPHFKAMNMKETRQAGITRIHFSLFSTDKKNKGVIGIYNQNTNEFEQLASFDMKLNPITIEKTMFTSVDEFGVRYSLTLSELHKMQEARADEVLDLAHRQGMDLSWEWFVCQYSGKVSCMFGCFLFAAMPLVMTACNLACGVLWGMGVCE